MPIELILPLSIVMSLAIYGLIATWYMMPRLLSLPRAQALVLLLLFHGFRFIGLAFLVPGVTSQQLDPRFAEQAAYGDVLAALLALLCILALRRGWRTAIPLVWVFNIEGTLDLLNAIRQGLQYTEVGMLGATFFIPAVIVPALLVTHVMVFILLLKSESRKNAS
ncbi:MAG: hypothetical protein OEM41_04915 [Ignavibacteria bacterium]|nr:hypothetical protein [Ignavibacteria bacterium]